MQKFLLKAIFCLSLSLFFLPFAANAQKNKKIKVETENKNAIIEKNAVLSAFEMEIIKEVNAARTNPAEYIGYLEEIKKFMKGKIRHIPPDIQLLTSEGIESVDDAIVELKKVSPAAPYMTSELISKAARKHLTDLMENPKLGHLGKDGSDPMDRINRENVFPKQAAENILRDTDSAREIILRTIIDDGVKTRSHRKNIFSEKFNTIGIAYGIGKNGQPIVVINFAGLPAQKNIK